jgi:hypothetical protein
MGKILLFVAFLAVYSLYLWTSMMLAKRYIIKTKNYNTFIENELMIVIPYFFFFALIFIAGRFINFPLLIFSILSSNIGLLITSIVWNLIGSPSTPYKEVGGWAGSDFGLKNMWLTLVSQGLIILMIIAFPIVIGVHFFSSSSEEVIRMVILKFSLILVLGAYILSLPIYIGVLSAGFIDEDTRARYFINLFSGMIANTLFLSLLIWTFNWANTGQILKLGNVNFSVNPQMFFILLGFIFAFLILPYFVGVQKAKRLKSDFLDKNKRLLNAIVETINLATEDDLVSKIEDLEKQVVDEYNKLIETDKGIEIGVKFDQLNTEEEVSQLEILQYKYFKIAREFDTRFHFYDFLNHTYIKLEELKTLEVAKADLDEKKKFQEKYVAHFQAYKEDLLNKDELKGKSNPALWIGIITLLSPLISQGMSEIGKYLIEIFKGM